MKVLKVYGMYVSLQSLLCIILLLSLPFVFPFMIEGYNVVLGLIIGGITSAYFVGLQAVMQSAFRSYYGRTFYARGDIRHIHLFDFIRPTDIV